MITSSPLFRARTISLDLEKTRVFTSFPLDPFFFRRDAFLEMKLPFYVWSLSKNSGELRLSDHGRVFLLLAKVELFL